MLNIISLSFLHRLHEISTWWQNVLLEMQSEQKSFYNNEKTNLSITILETNLVDLYAAFG